MEETGENCRPVTENITIFFFNGIFHIKEENEEFDKIPENSILELHTGTMDFDLLWFKKKFIPNIYIMDLVCCTNSHWFFNHEYQHILRI
jgi:hypothetical protein